MYFIFIMMMKLKRKLFITMLSIWIALITWNFSYAKDYEYKNLDIQANVRMDWMIDVKETFTTNFLFDKHGIVREIPLNYSVGWNDFHIDIYNVAVWWFNYEVNKYWWNVDIKIWDANRTVIWEQIYPISYSVYWLIRNFSWMWYSELYWNLVWYDFDTNIDKVRAEIILPKNYSFKSDDFLITVDWKESSVSSFAWRVDWSKWDRIIITYNKWLNPFEWITLAIKFPNDYFEFDHKKQASLLWHVSWIWGFSNVNLGSFPWKKLVIYWFIFVFLIALIWADEKRRIKRFDREIEMEDRLSLKVDNSELVSHKIKRSEIESKLKNEKPIVVRYFPPEWVNCAEAWMLYNCILEPTDLTSLLYKWAIEWLISISMEESTNFERKDWFVVTKLKDIDGKRPKYERNFFYSIFTSYDTKSKKYISVDSDFDISNALRALRMYGRLKWWVSVWIINNSKDIYWFIIWVLIFVVLYFFKVNLFLIILFLFLYLFVFSSLIVKPKVPMQKKIYLTKKWKELASWVIWYAHFIKMCDENKLRLFLEQDPAFFDKTLPYAVAFWFETLFINKITPLLDELDVRLSWFVWNLYDIDSVSKVVDDMIIEQLHKKERERRAKESSNSSSYDSFSWFSSGSSFSSWWFSRWWWGGWWGSRSR